MKQMEKTDRTSPCLHGVLTGLSEEKKEISNEEFTKRQDAREQSAKGHQVLKGGHTCDQGLLRTRRGRTVKDEEGAGRPVEPVRGGEAEEGIPGLGVRACAEERKARVISRRSRNSLFQLQHKTWKE